MYHCLPAPESTFVCSPGSDRDSEMRLDVLENLAPSPLIFTQYGVVLGIWLDCNYREYVNTSKPNLQKGVSNLWNGLWNGLMEWTDGMDWWNGLMEWTDGMDWWNGISANQNCQNSLSYVVAVAKYCLAIAHFNWIVMSSLFSSLVPRPTHGFCMWTMLCLAWITYPWYWQCGSIPGDVCINWNEPKFVKPNYGPAFGQSWLHVASNECVLVDMIWVCPGFHEVRVKPGAWFWRVSLRYLRVGYQ